jgi:hypothetical protein
MSKHDFYLPGPENPMTSDPMHNFTRLVAREIPKAFSDGFKAGAGAERSEAIRMAIRKAEAFDKIEREKICVTAGLFGVGWSLGRRGGTQFIRPDLTLLQFVEAWPPEGTSP